MLAFFYSVTSAMERICRPTSISFSCRGADTSLERIEKGKSSEACQATRAISTTSRREMSSSFSLQGKAPKEIHAILRENLIYSIPGRTKDLSASLCTSPHFTHCIITPPTPFPLYDKATHTMTYNFTETFTIFCLLSSTQHTN